MEEEIKKIKKEIVKLKVRVFDSETEVNEITEKLEIVLLLIKNAIKILEREELKRTEEARIRGEK